MFTTIVVGTNWSDTAEVALVSRIAPPATC